MYLVTILAFAVLFSAGEQPSSWILVGHHDVFWTLLIVLVQPVLLGALAWLTARRAWRMLDSKPGDLQAPQLAQHHATLALRVITLVGFAADVALTRWPEWFRFSGISPWLQIVGDLIVLSPFLIGVITVWIVQYPLEQRLRQLSLEPDAGPAPAPWPLRRYLDFNIRHHLLIVGVPLTLILFASNLLRGYEKRLQIWSGWLWTPDVLMGLVAVSVFLMAPILLIRIWRTVPLQAGPVRQRLEALSDRIGLRCRDIMVWPSDGMLINAAVMGVAAPVRYVLLSDGLLASMSVEQIEAVFGHEAGHVRHRHMQHFLVFALVGWLIVAGLMELMAWASINPQIALTVSPLAIQVIGGAATILFWGVGFGWLSRRFERQADRFGACCVAPPAHQCTLPCSVHLGDAAPVSTGERVCSSGAAIFTSALERVALLNGIPQHERSWRHSSIGSRIRFLTSLAGDPARSIAFERMIRRIKTGMLCAAILGTSFCVYYWNVVPEPAIMRLHAGVP